MKIKKQTDLCRRFKNKKKKLTSNLWTHKFKRHFSRKVVTENILNVVHSVANEHSYSNRTIVAEGEKIQLTLADICAINYLLKCRKEAKNEIVILKKKKIYAMNIMKHKH